MMQEPWLSVNAKEHLEFLLDCWFDGSDTLSIFEWGVGGTTKLFNELTDARTVTIEHDPRFIRKFREVNPKIDADIRLVHLGPSYPLQIAGPKDLICIDGRMRVECFKRAISFVKPGGVLILDNSERPRYQSVFQMLPRDFTYHRIFGPGEGGRWETTFFVRDK